NAKAFTPDGFYRTGDVVRMTPEGNLVVEGRAKDQINRGGEKIAAEEVENHLLAHPAVFDAAVVSMPDDYLGERSCAFVVPRGAPPTARELIKFVRSRGLASYKVPDRVEFVEQFPQTGVGKISKRELREVIAREYVPKLKRPVKNEAGHAALATVAPSGLPRPAELPNNRVACQPEPEPAVLLVHDMERHFVGQFTPGREPLSKVVENISLLSRQARAAGIPVVYCAQPGPQTPEQRGLQLEWWGTGVADPEQAEIIDELRPEPGDVLLTKWRYSAFQRTELAEMMQDWQR